MLTLLPMTAVGCMIRNALSDHLVYCTTYVGSFSLISKNNSKQFSSTHGATTVNPEEVKKYQNYSSDWWNRRGKFGPLHSFNSLRVPLIRDCLRKRDAIITPKPLTGFKILDVGCGAGILSEPLARLGAKVTGIDPAAEHIKIAQQHCLQDSLISSNLNYICTTVEDIAASCTEKYDAVVASEVFEHVDNVDLFLSSCINVLKDEGSIFLTTINRTLASYWLAIIAAERIFRIVPDGTHDWNKFILPTDLQFMLESFGCHVKLLHGTCYNPLTDSWSWTKTLSVTYALHAVKLAAQSQ